jgi:hypothetical protein
LLDLARTLLERARDDLKERVPVVLNLSSWKKNQPLVEWIAAELSEKYRVPNKIARFWREQDYLLPLLDGLDEVETLRQPDCVAAINAFIEGSNPSGLVVCCRLLEYRWLPERLKLNGAICLEPLSPEEVRNYLDGAGPGLAALREALDADPVLQELAQTPLMLSVMSLACQDASGNRLAGQDGESVEERRKQIVGLYVERMFQRKGSALRAFPKEGTIGWLSWLAGKMRENSESVFLVEGLQPGWLNARAERVAYGTIAALSLGLIFGLLVGLIFELSGGLIHALIFGESFGLAGGWPLGLVFGLSIMAGVGTGCWSELHLRNGIVSGLAGGLCFGLIGGLIGGLSVQTLIVGLVQGLIGGLIACLIVGPIVGLIGGLGAGSLQRITPVETMRWKWSQFWKRTISGLAVGLPFGLVFGLLFGLIEALIVGLSGGLKHGLEVGLRGMLSEGLPLGIFLGVLAGLVTGLVGGFTGTVKPGKVSPNQGIKLSRNNALVASLIVCLTVGLSLGLSFGKSFGLLIGLLAALTVGLNRGGSAVLKHFALRLVLWRKGCAPLDLVRFLDGCARLILLKKVGGAYIFAHRMLLDYFAEMPNGFRAKN